MPDPRSRPLRCAAAALCLAALAACGSAGASDDQPAGTVGGVGRLPDRNATSVPVPASDGPSGAVRTGTDGDPDVDPASLPISERISGNRLLMVGDSIFAGTASRYGGEACETLVPLNWQVSVEAESGRAIDFGERVVRTMMPEGWDVVVFFLGTNYGGNEVGYREYLVKALDEIGPDTPVVLITTTVYAPKQEEVNTAIREEAAERPNVTVLEWAELSEQPHMLAGDGYHPSDTGRQALVDAIALTIGEAPVGPGDCLSSTHRQDIPNTPGAPTTSPRSSGSGYGGGSSSGSGSSGSGSSGSGSGSGSSSGSGSGSGYGGGSGSGSGSTDTTTTTVWSPPTYTPPSTTQPPVTEPEPEPEPEPSPTTTTATAPANPDPDPDPEPADPDPSGDGDTEPETPVPDEADQPPADASA